MVIKLHFTKSPLAVLTVPQLLLNMSQSVLIIKQVFRKIEVEKGDLGELEKGRVDAERLVHGGNPGLLWLL